MGDIITITMIEGELSADRLAKLSDFEPDHQPPVRDDAYIENVVIAEAEREVKAKLAHRYDFEHVQGDVPGVIVSWTLNLACYKLYANRPTYRALGIPWKRKAEDYEGRAMKGQLGPDVTASDGTTTLAQRRSLGAVRGPEAIIGGVTDEEYF